MSERKLVRVASAEDVAAKRSRRIKVRIAATVVVLLFLASFALPAGEVRPASTGFDPSPPEPPQAQDGGLHALAAVVAVAAAGGLMQEVLQSGGVVVLPKRRPDGTFYLGTVLGVFVGACGGLLLLGSGTDAGIGLAFAAGFGAKSSIETLPRVTRLRQTASEAAGDAAPGA